MKLALPLVDMILLSLETGAFPCLVQSLRTTGLRVAETDDLMGLHMTAQSKMHQVLSNMNTQSSRPHHWCKVAVRVSSHHTMPTHTSPFQ